jgi:mannose-6-phosphate isomerase-like protein (cupin superfamily)
LDHTYGDRVIHNNNASSGGAFSLLQLNAQNYIRSGYGDLFQAPPHYHSRFHETFFSRKGRTTLWANKEARILYPYDFGSMPVYQNHSYQLVEPDTEFWAFISPGGFEDFYINISKPYNPATDAPFPPDRPQHFLEKTFIAAIGPKYDVIPVNYTFAYNFTNGTTDLSKLWHNGPNPLPEDSIRPYFIASNYGPKHLNNPLGQVIEPLVGVNQSGGNFTLDLVTMRRMLANETLGAPMVFNVPHTFLVLEGQLTISMCGQQADMIPGDVAFVPAGTPFQYWSKVAFTKVLVGAGGVGLGDALLKSSVPWKYAVFPSYIG